MLPDPALPLNRPGLFAGPAVNHSAGPVLTLAARVRGVGGYDHVAAALLTALPAARLGLRAHHRAEVRTDLLPPGLVPPTVRRRPGDPQLVLGPPFLVGRFDPDRTSAVYTMWETDTLAAEWVDVLNRSAVVLVPSRWQVEGFRRSGVAVPIEVVPLGHDPAVYRPAGGFPGVCTFGTAGALTAGGVRKNAQAVVDLFRRAFPAEADVRLRVKVSPGSPGVETYDDPRVEVLRAALPRAELADWYRSLTAYVNASHGEGFGLHLLEAMACGRPLVSPCYSGLTEFFDPSVGYPVGYDLVPVRGTDVYAGRWAEPDEGDLIARMREVYADRRAAERLGAAAADRARGFTWSATAAAVAAVLRRHGLIPAPD
jgi:glycosyltransferase involved in cell wall biosynthesis